MSNVVVSGAAGWSLAAADFTNPSYISGPAGNPDPQDATGFDINAGGTLAIAFDGTYTGQTLVHEQTMDGAGLNGWFPVLGLAVGAGGESSTGVSTSGVCYLFPATGVRARMRVTALATGTMVARISLVDDLAGISAEGGSGAPVVVTEQGLPNLGTNQVSIATSATPLVAARAGRGSVVVVNPSTVTCYVGAAGVTTNNGLPVLPGGFVVLPTTAAVYAISSSGTQTMAFAEVYA